MRAPFTARWSRYAPRIAVVAYGLAVVAGACTSTNTTLLPPTAIGFGVTSVSVDPADFLGGVPCSAQPGAMASYVATLTDVTDPENPFTLPSSPPMPCSQVTFFQNVNPYDFYTAEIDGYTQAASKLVPLCGALPPGSVTSCTANSDCAPAYGCQGNCKLTTYQNANWACVGTCVAAGKDAGAADAGPDAGPTHTCDSCLATFGDPSAWAACLEGPGCGASEDCLSQNNDCLVNDFPALQKDCPTEPQDTTPGDGGLVSGAIKACVCVYIPTEGSRQMFLAGDPTATVPVAPVWGTTCGEPDMPPQAQAYVDVPIEPCIPLVGNAVGTTSIVVVPSAALGNLTCRTTTDAGATGTVTGFEVVPSASDMTLAGTPPLATQTVPGCPGGSVVYATGLIPEFDYWFTVYAYENNATTPTQYVCCNRSPELGIAQNAQCDIFVPIPDGGPPTCGP